MKNTYAIILGILVLIGIVFLATKNSKEESNMNTEMTNNDTNEMNDKEINMENMNNEKIDTEVSVGVDLGGNVKEFVVTGGNFAFSPKMMTVNKGDTVKIIFKNTEGFHDFVLDEFNVKSKKDQGPFEDTITFVADKTGTFEYYCSVGTHRQMGMVGTLIVK